MTEVTIIQPYVPQYRLPFFNGLQRSLRERGVNLRVVAGEADGEQAQRGDSAHAPWLEEVRSRGLRIGSRRLALTFTAPLWRHSDAVIVPHQGSSLDSLVAISGRRPSRVGVWGHIASYTGPLNPLDGAVERWQMRNAQHVFAYTPGGAEFARVQGVPAERITTVMNTIDTSGLEAALEHATDERLAEFRSRHSIPDSPYLAYVGGLDSSKRIDLLAASLDILHSRGSTAHVVVAGRGEQEHLLHPAATRGQVSLIGYSNVTTKGLLLKGSAAIVNPGRVGLIAVDALVAKKQLLTTFWPWHAPELDYLTPGVHVLFYPDSAESFADGLDEILSISDTRSSTSWPPPPRMDQMVLNFSEGISALLSS